MTRRVAFSAILLLVAFAQLAFAQRRSQRGPDPAAKKFDTSQLKPLTDLGTAKYHDFEGGLYPNGKNDRPAAHEPDGVALSKLVRPLVADGSLKYEPGDLAGDGTHPSPSGQRKVAAELLRFFKSDSTTKSWFASHDEN